MSYNVEFGISRGNSAHGGVFDIFSRWGGIDIRLRDGHAVLNKALSFD